MIRLIDLLKEEHMSKDIRIHMSKKPLILKNKTYSQSPASKPNGFWYGFGDSWLDWVDQNMPEWKGKYIYQVDIADSNVLKIKTYQQLISFTKEYSISQFQIDWKKVSSKYAGIEINPYQHKARMNMDFLWYYGWDIGSGCIWDHSKVKLVSITPNN